ncbi:MAG: ATP-dependent DNA helicase [Clostridia bacterium]|nr:ATP-dependent DNA helicase [Clostridia bacterium]
MHQASTYKISVRNLIEYAMKTGDAYAGYVSSFRMVEGIKAHTFISKSSTEEYLPEVPVSILIERDNILLEVSGRVDGIIKSEEEIVIDEIKSTTIELDEIEEDYNPMHWAQAKCYAYIYGFQNCMESLKVQITYYNIDSGSIKCFSKIIGIKELEYFFYELVDKYVLWLKTLHDWEEIRNESISKLEFPFETYRKGQRSLSAAVYRAIKEEGKLFAQAPTGIGKTMAAIFPSLKAMGQGYASKIFYLTAKTITRSVAEAAFERLRSKGLRLKTVTITAKEKICCNGVFSCKPENCEFIRGYYDRVNGAIQDIFVLDSFTRDTLSEYAHKHRICPFEFSLDISLWSDYIICDYNYAFDPGVYLKRYFMLGTGDYVFLVDEAHNLVDRAREMFSAYIGKKKVLDLKREVKGVKNLEKSIGAINDFLIGVRKKLECEDTRSIVKKEPDRDFYSVLKKFTVKADKYLSGSEPLHFRDKLLEFYLEAMSFLRIAEFFNERYVTYYERNTNDIILKLFCLDPSFLLNQAMKRAKASILFSATLSPMKYFAKILGGDEELDIKEEKPVSRIRLPSPFPRENLCIMMDPTTSTRYSTREFSYNKIALSLYTFSSSKPGNFLVYFPSYSYMNEVYVRFTGMNTGVGTICQKPDMTESEREMFLEEFAECRQGSLLGFAVMGGVFGEGIDLIGERLSGVVVVGVGLPQICLERDIIRNYFDEQNGQGFEYAYIYPGMNKVMQAVGRVIRTEEDKGAVLLIDERFSYSAYRGLFPTEWHPVIEVKGNKSLKEILEDFWTNCLRD